MTKRKLVHGKRLEKYQFFSHQEENQMTTMSLIFQHKHFHFIHSEVLTSCQKIETILTYWALVCIAKVNGAVGRIWRVANVKVMSTSKYWTIATVAVDGISFHTIYQRQLCWWQATGIDKAEQERTWCSFVQSSI